MVWGRTSASHPGLVDILLVTSWETHWTLMVNVLDSGSRGPGSNTGLRVERSWFEHWTPGREVLIRDQAASVLCSWAKHLTRTVPLHIQEYGSGILIICKDVTFGWTSVPSREE